MRLLKCKQCGIKSQSDLIIKFVDTYGKNDKEVNMCSQQCIEDYCKDKESKKIERDNYIKLVEYIMKLHNISFIPNFFYMRLNDLKKGVIRSGSKIILQSKSIEWNELLIAYEYSASTIQSVKLTKEFNGVYNELAYCLSIVKNNFYKANQLDKQCQLNNKVAVSLPITEDNYYKYKKQVFKDDISDLL